MNPLTYLGFTIFSVIMQFCVMEFIHEKFKFNKNSASFNEGVHENDDLMKEINYKPHALFYRNEIDNITLKNNNYGETTKQSNTPFEGAILTSTDISSTTFDVYYENTSIIDDYFSTESYSTSLELDNVTEITLLDKINTTAKPSVVKKATSNKNCFCNLLYQKCDISCCCDTDCAEEERSLFTNCFKDGSDKFGKSILFSNSYSSCKNTISTDVFNDIICVAKVNLPDKRIKSHFQLHLAALNETFKWNKIDKSVSVLHFERNKYKYGDPLWVLKNGVISSLSLPTTMTNYYCNGNKQLKFLINENIKCYVKFKDAYIFSALNTLEGTKVISVTELSNITVLNCSTLHCADWTVLGCVEEICNDYNKTKHTPKCTDNYCNNVAHTIEYNFYYFDSKIINATLKFYFSNIPMTLSLIMQKITVKWYLGNESIDNIVQLSGNPGYIPGLPLIVSPATNNHTTNFYNQTYGKSLLPMPQNVNGQCNWSNINNKTLLFGLNTRSKCRMNIKQNVSGKNATWDCQAIQTNIKQSLRLQQKLFISPYGNPRDISDDKWIALEFTDRTFLYGEYRSKNKKLICYHFVTRYEFLIAYADNGDERVENIIVKATVGVKLANVTLDLAKLSLILTIDVRFIDISRPTIETARAPNLNIHLPSNFFFDNPSNISQHHTPGVIVLFILVMHYLLLLVMK